MFGFAKHGCGATGVYIEFQRDENEIITIKYKYRQTEIENQTICETKLGLFNPAISKLYIASCAKIEISLYTKHVPLS